VSPLQFKGWIVTAAARDSRGRTYVAVGSAVYGAAVLVSDDLESWEQLEGAPRYEAGERGNAGHNLIVGSAAPGQLDRYVEGGRHVDQIWTLRAAGDVVYAGVSEAGLFRTDDRGKSWQPVRGLNDHETQPDWLAGAGGLCAHTILVDPRNRERIWVGISAAGVFRSDDGGHSFVGANEGVSRDEGYCVHSLAQDPDDANLIFRQDHRGMYRTRNGGDSWDLIENGLPLSRLGDDHECVFGFAVALDPRTKDVFNYPLEGESFRLPHDGKPCVYRTQDGGESWQGHSTGLPDHGYACVLRGAMAVDGLDPGGVYIGTTSGEVYASRDRGESWNELPCRLPRVLSVQAFEV
jgi:photosystem II stability/assembly factor-like uncharacterized protein